MKKELSVIIPAYNEEEHLEQTVESVVEYFHGKRYAFEVLLVNDGSTDSTLECARGLEKRLQEVRVIDLGINQGKGTAVKEGIKHARFTYCLFMDADNSTAVAEWDKFERHFESGARAVIASRRLSASKIVHPQPALRRTLGGVYRVICRGFFGLSASDLNCGFKAYETSLAKRIYSQVRMNDWTFDLETLCLLKEDGVSVAEVPVRWEHREKQSNLKPLSAGLRSLRSIAVIRKNLGKVKARV